MHEALTSAGYDREWYVFLHGQEWLSMFSDVQTLQQTPIPKTGTIILGGPTPKAKREAELTQLRLNGIKVAQVTILDFLHQSETKYKIAPKYQLQPPVCRRSNLSLRHFDATAKSRPIPLHPNEVTPLARVCNG
jgi:hypothetical protein